MSTAYTLASLKTFLQEMIEDDGADYTANLDDIIKSGEDRCLVDLDLDIFDGTGSVTLVNGVQTANLPSGMIKIRAMHFTNGGDIRFIEQRGYDYLLTYWPTATNTSLPVYFNQLNTTQVMVVPTPNSNITATARGIKRPNSLTVDTGGTWLSTNVGSLLLKACLVVSEQWDVSDERIPMWKQEYAEDLISRRHEFRHLMRKDFQLWQPPQKAA